MFQHWVQGATHRLAHIVAALVALVAFGAVTAAADEWQVGKVSGQVAVSSAFAQPVAVKAGMTLGSGQTLQTAKDGRAFLVHGNDTVTVGPNTVISVPLWSAIGMTKLVQQSGVIELEVEKLARPHLTVETPYLAAVVKGTHFTVTVGQGSAKVAVTRGLVQVSDFASGRSAEVGAGQEGSVTTGAPGVAVTGQAPAPPAAPPPATTTGGLVGNITANNGSDGQSGGNGNGNGNGGQGNNGNGGSHAGSGSGGGSGGGGASNSRGKGKG